MDLYLTNGLKGKKIECIAKDIHLYDDVMYLIDLWKDNNSNKYRIVSYNQLTLSKTSIAVDFGDYSTFMLIDNISDSELSDIQSQLTRM